MRAYFADILEPKNFKPKTQLCNFWCQNFVQKVGCVKRWWNLLQVPFLWRKKFRLKLKIDFCWNKFSIFVINKFSSLGSFGIPAIFCYKYYDKKTHCNGYFRSLLTTLETFLGTIRLLEKNRLNIAPCQDKIFKENAFDMINIRHAQHLARGPNVARRCFTFGPPTLYEIEYHKFSCVL